MATNPAPRILDVLNASEELAERAEQDAAARQAAWDDRVRRLLLAADAARDHTITPTAGKGIRSGNAGVNPTGKNYYRDWAVKWLVLADALRDGGWLPAFEKIRNKKVGRNFQVAINALPEKERPKHLPPTAP